MRIMVKKSEDHLRYLVTSPGLALHDDIIYEEESLKLVINGSEVVTFSQVFLNVYFNNLHSF